MYDYVFNLIDKISNKYNTMLYAICDDDNDIVTVRNIRSVNRYVVLDFRNKIVSVSGDKFELRKKFLKAFITTLIKSNICLLYHKKGNYYTSHPTDYYDKINLLSYQFDNYVDPYAYVCTTDYFGKKYFISQIFFDTRMPEYEINEMYNTLSRWNNINFKIDTSLTRNNIFKTPMLKSAIILVDGFNVRLLYPEVKLDIVVNYCGNVVNMYCSKRRLCLINNWYVHPQLMLEVYENKKIFKELCYD